MALTLLLLHRTTIVSSIARLVTIAGVTLTCFTVSAEQIRKVRTSFAMGPSGQVLAEVRYEFDSLPSDMAFKFLLIGHASISELQLLVGDDTATYEITKDIPQMLSGLVHLPTADISHEIIAKYEVYLGPNWVNSSLPVLLFESTPPQVRDGVFSSEVSFTEGYELTPRFPLVDWQVQDQTARFNIQVIPSIIKFKLTKTEQAMFDSTILIDIVVIAVLLVISVYGWRRLRLPEE